MLQQSCYAPQMAYGIWLMQYFPNIAETKKCINNEFLNKLYRNLSLDF